MIEYVTIPEERLNILKRDDRWRKQLAKLVDADIILGEEVSIECGDPFMLRRLVEVIKAFGRGFEFDDTLNLLDEGYKLEVVDIRGYAGKSKNRQFILRGRLIGKDGTIKKMIEKSCDAKIAVYGKTVSIICRSIDMERTVEVVEMVLSGSKFGTVARFLKGGGASRLPQEARRGYSDKISKT